MYALTYTQENIQFIKKEGLIHPKLKKGTKWEDLPAGMVPIRLSETGFGREYKILYSKTEFASYKEYPDLLMMSLYFVRAETLIKKLKDQNTEDTVINELRKNFL